MFIIKQRIIKEFWFRGQVKGILQTNTLSRSRRIELKIPAVFYKASEKALKSTLVDMKVNDIPG